MIKCLDVGANADSDIQIILGFQKNLFLSSHNGSPDLFLRPSNKWFINVSV